MFVRARTVVITCDARREPLMWWLIDEVGPGDQRVILRHGVRATRRFSSADI
jgi:hypothetical protein